MLQTQESGLAHSGRKAFGIFQTFSKPLGVNGQAMSTYEKELMAPVTAVKKWASYRINKHFFVKNDHWALKFLTEQKVTNLLQQKWISILMGYNYTILYRKGKDNTIAVLSSFVTDYSL